MPITNVRAHHVCSSMPPRDGDLDASAQLRSLSKQWMRPRRSAAPSKSMSPIWNSASAQCVLVGLSSRPRRARSRGPLIGHCGVHVDLAERSCRGARLRHASRREAAVPADADRTPRRGRDRHRQRQAGTLLTPDERRLLDALIAQGALAIERVHLVEDMDRVKLTIETDRLRAALLPSISHDLKTPLATVLGAAGALRDLSEALAEAEKANLLTTIIDESERLNRFIANLLDMTKLEVGRRCAKQLSARSQRDRWERAAAREQDSRESPRGGESSRGPADAKRRRRSVRASLTATRHDGAVVLRSGRENGSAGVKQKNPRKSRFRAKILSSRYARAAINFPGTKNRNNRGFPHQTPW